MKRFLRHHAAKPPETQAFCRDWPRDAVLKRRRSVLFAFTFSPHATSH
ncbi:hypothetical protein [Pseudomonas fontis]|uniref:DUF1534 domain-containing protein n=1 Tax=Pseudomonas fontis TaxID=2942633 RepID=A0ABT5NT65_9PSED|nr:hypothetical protein [Pseudomonas fontis]MDD0975117.1 hypothetical protein [Pseudomonas fontis]MDD0991341.1 hypothetical protein [Pseudomonas fontis]